MRYPKSVQSAVWIAILMLVVGALPTRALAQDPTGSIEGKVTDSSNAVVSGADVVITQAKTGYERHLMTSSDGQYRFTQLTPGMYDINVTASGFKKTAITDVTVAVGQHTALDVELTVGGVGEVVEIAGGEAQIDRVDQAVDGVVNTIQIANLPLNGRNFLDLARLEPGAETVAGGDFDPTKANYTGVSLGGQAGRSTQISIDGGSVVDNVVGTTVQNFSQDVIEEFQIGISNQGVESGASGSGVINVITKSGSNDFHGNGFVYYRDDSFAAFPALNRLQDTDLSDDVHPFEASRAQFDREQVGGTIGGPIVTDKAFFFFNTEYNNQDSVSIFNIPSSRILGFNGVGGQPFNELTLTARVDWQYNDKQKVFGRYSHDDNDQVAPFPTGSGITPRDSTTGIFSSNSQFDTNRSDGFIIGLTSVVTPNLVNDFRYAYNNFKNDIEPDPASAVGSPQINVIEGSDQSWRSGTNYITPQVTTQKRNQIRDDLSWTVGAHNLRFGLNYERTAIGGRFAYSKPARIRLYGPATTGAILSSENDFLDAPVRDITMGIGNDLLPFTDPGGSTKNNRFQPYFNDSWKIHPRFTLNYGVQYRYDTDLYNTDLSRPAVIAPLFGRGTAAPKNDTNNIGPRVGFAWDVAGDAKTVIRGGVGIYYDTTIDNLRLFEGADVSPPGAELFLVGADIKSALLPGGDGRFGATPTSSTGYLTLRDALGLIAAVRSDVEARAASSTAATSIEATQSVSGPLFSTEFQLPYSIQYAIGAQRELPGDMVLQADFNYRKGLHEVITYDANYSTAVDRFGDSLAVIPASVFSPDGVNPVGVPYADAGGFSVYKALLVRLDKRFTHNWQFTASYTLASLKAFGGDTLGLGESPTNLFNLRDDYGPAGLDRRNRFVLSTLYDFPRYKGDNWGAKAALDGWSASLISTAYSGLPNSVLLPNDADLFGSGSFLSYLPGTGNGSIGRSVKSIAQLNDIITGYNASIPSYAVSSDGGHYFDYQGDELAPLALLPADTPLGGDSLISQDVRFTKRFYFSENTHLDLIFEGFNIFNVANLVSVTNNVLVPQADVDAYESNANGDNPSGYKFPFSTLHPTSRVPNVFGTGGPRAFQFALKFVF